MANHNELDAKLQEVSQALGLEQGTFNVNGSGYNEGTSKLSVATWAFDYTVGTDKLYGLLSDPKALLLAIIRLSAP